MFVDGVAEFQAHRNHPELQSVVVVDGQAAGWALSPAESDSALVVVSEDVWEWDAGTSLAHRNNLVLLFVVAAVAVVVVVVAELVAWSAAVLLAVTE